MFGWDWGPRLPDQGIWKDVKLLGWNDVRIADIRVKQEILTEEGIPVDEAEDGGRSAHKGRVRAYLTAEVITEGAAGCLPRRFGGRTAWAGSRSIPCARKLARRRLHPAEKEMRTGKPVRGRRM